MPSRASGGHSTSRRVVQRLPEGLQRGSNAVAGRLGRTTARLPIPPLRPGPGGVHDKKVRIAVDFSFAAASDLLWELAAVRVERCAEALGREVAADERAVAEQCRLTLISQ